MKEISSGEASDAEVFEALRTIPSPTVSNAIELFDVRGRDEGFADFSIRCVFPDMGVVVGRAVTVRISTSAPDSIETNFRYWKCPGLATASRGSN
jgi:hypothetical protein